MVRSSDNFCCKYHTYLKACFIKIVDILFKNTIFCYSILNKIEPILDNIWILTLCLLIIILAIVF